MPDNNPNGGGAGPELVSMAQAFSGLPMEQLIGGPLSAAAKANHQMACDQVRYMLTSCFNMSKSTDGKSKSYSPIMIAMKVSRPALTARDPNNGPPGKNDATVQVIESTIEVPMLAIIPLNSLAVDSVDVKFDMEVKSSYGEDHHDQTAQNNEEKGGFEGTGWIGPFKCTISGSVTHDSSQSTDTQTHYQKSNDATYHVEVHATQIPMPPGVGVIIQAFTNNIAPVTMPTAANDPANAGQKQA